MSELGTIDYIVLGIFAINLIVLIVTLKVMSKPFKIQLIGVEEVHSEADMKVTTTITRPEANRSARELPKNHPTKKPVIHTDEALWLQEQAEAVRK